MHVKASRMHAAFVAATATWALLLLLAPGLASRSRASAFGAGLVVAVYAVGSIVCHQLPERSFHLWTAQMPVCARCTGIYVGAAVMAIGAFGARRSPERLALRRIALPGRARLMLVGAVAPTAVTLLFEWTTGRAPGNWIRFAAGIPIGVAVAWLVRSAAENQVN
jgi:uncharacterized membrane protein